MLKKVMLETEMENYLIKEGYHVFTEDRELLDSYSVADFSVNELGYNSYVLEGVGNYDRTLVFIREKNNLELLFNKILVAGRLN